MKKTGGIAGYASRMAGSPLPITDSEEKTNKENNQVNFIPESNSSDGTSGTNIIKGIKDFYNLVDKSGLLTEDKVNETKENLLNIADENKNNNKSESNKDTTSSDDSKLLSYNFQGLDPRKDIFNYNPRGNVGFDIRDKEGGFFATGDVDASLSGGIKPNYDIGFNNDNLNLNFGDTGFTGNFNKKFGEDTNVNVDARNGNINPSFDTSILGSDFNINKNQANLARNFLNDKVNVNIAQNFDGDTNISGTYTGDDGLKATINPNEFLLNKTFQIGGGDLTLGGTVGFDGQTTGRVDYEKELGPGKLNVFANPNDYGFGYNFLNRKF